MSRIWRCTQHACMWCRGLQWREHHCMSTDRSKKLANKCRITVSDKRPPFLNPFNQNQHPYQVVAFDIYSRAIFKLGTICVQEANRNMAGRFRYISTGDYIWVKEWNDCYSQTTCFERKTHWSHLFVSFVNAPSCFGPVPVVTLQSASVLWKKLTLH